MKKIAQALVWSLGGVFALFPDIAAAEGFQDAAGDFDGDGGLDVMVHQWRDDFVSVRYSNGSEHRLSQADLSAPSSLFDRLSSAASGDFDGDGFDDLALGNRRDYDYGGVIVVWGSPQGLSLANHSFAANFDGSNDYKKGRSLAFGDFNNDGRDDLAIGIPGRFGNEGTVEVIFGNAGRDLVSNDVWRLLNLRGDTISLDEGYQRGDQFGFSLASGDFDNDGHADLAIGAPDLDQRGGGRVFWMYGGPGTNLSEYHYEVTEGSNSGDYLGYALAAGHYDEDAFEDLAIGAPGQDDLQGAVIVMHGTTTRFPLRIQRITKLDIQRSSSFDDIDWFGGNLDATRMEPSRSVLRIDAGRCPDGACTGIHAHIPQSTDGLDLSNSSAMLSYLTYGRGLSKVWCCGGCNQITGGDSEYSSSKCNLCTPALADDHVQGCVGGTVRFECSSKEHYNPGTGDLGCDLGRVVND